METSDVLDVKLLLPFVRALKDVATSGGRLRRKDLEASEVAGRQAALSGVPLASLVDGYPSASRLVWVSTMESLGRLWSAG